MKIAITSKGKDLNAEIDPRFGRCMYIIIFDLETQDIELKENINMQMAGGAGTKTAHTLVENDIEAVLTGNVGPNAFMTLQAANIEVYTGLSGKISDVIENFKKGIRNGDNVELAVWINCKNKEDYRETAIHINSNCFLEGNTLFEKHPVSLKLSQ